MLAPRVLHFSAIHYLGHWSLLYCFFVPLVMKLICPNDRMNMTETKNWEQETKLWLELAPSIHRLLPCRKTKTGVKCLDLGTNKQLWCILHSLFKRLYMYCSLANEYPRQSTLQFFKRGEGHPFKGFPHLNLNNKWWVQYPKICAVLILHLNHYNSFSRLSC